MDRVIIGEERLRKRNRDAHAWVDLCLRDIIIVMLRGGLGKFFS